MRILLTNDDGIDAPGIAALHETVFHSLGHWRPTVMVVAPDRGRSECSHSVTNAEPLTVQRHRMNDANMHLTAVESLDGNSAVVPMPMLSPGSDSEWYAVSGTPVDCVRVALQAFKFQPDVVFSGINAGANLGANLMVSGTFAAARESALLGVPAMAVSHYRHPRVPKTWDHAPRWLRRTMVEFVEKIQDNNSSRNESEVPLWNVNLPALDPATQSVDVAVCALDRNPIAREGVIENGNVRYELDFHNRPRDQGTDVDLCFSGSLTISRLTPWFQPARDA